MKCNHNREEFQKKFKCKFKKFKYVVVLFFKAPLYYILALNLTLNLVLHYLGRIKIKSKIKK